MRKRPASPAPVALNNAELRALSVAQERVAEAHERLLAATDDPQDVVAFQRKRAGQIDAAGRLRLARGAQLLRGLAPVTAMSLDDLWALVAYAGRVHPTWR